MTGKWAATNTLREIAEFHRSGATFLSQIEQVEKHERYAEYLALVEAALDASWTTIEAHYTTSGLDSIDKQALWDALSEQHAALRAVREGQ